VSDKVFDDTSRYEDDDYCFACGMSNPKGLKLEFQLDPDNTLRLKFTPDKTYQGFKNVTHGGILGLLFDEMMVNLPWKLGMKAVSAQFSVRLKQPVPTGTELEFACRIKDERGKLIRLEAHAKNPSGQIVAEAEGTCVKMSQC